MNDSLQQRYTQRQTQHLSPQLIQNQYLLALSTDELNSALQEFVENNPALELLDTHVYSGNNKSNSAYEKNMHKDYNNIDTYAQKYMVGETTCLFEHLYKQLCLEKISHAELIAGEWIIDNLDERGFHRLSIDELITETKYDSTLMYAMEKRIQALDPIGCATQNSEHSLAVQCALHENAPVYAYEIICDHLKDLAQHKYNKISKHLGCSFMDIQKAGVFIAQLFPHPGNRYTHSMPTYIYPDAEIYAEYNAHNEKVIHIHIYNNYIFQVHISSEFAKFYTTSTQQDKLYMSTHMQEAYSIIKSMQYRKDNFKRLLYGLKDMQYKFFLEGPRAYCAIQQKAMAEYLNLDPSVISRLCSSKYIQTKWGLFPLRYFFTRNTYKSHHSVYPHGIGKEAIKYMITQYLITYNYSITDQKIVELLHEKDIIISRRTVNKYRLELSKGR